MILAPLLRVAAALAEPGQPHKLFEAVEAATQEAIGHKLFTLMTWEATTGEAARIYSSNPVAYPVGGRKAMADTPFAKQVLWGQRPYLGRTRADLEWAFADHPLIFSLGLGSVINVLVRYDGKLLGMMNLLHEEHYYRDRDLAAAMPFAALLVPAYREWIAKG